jgi:hypothetical protein
MFKMREISEAQACEIAVTLAELELRSVEGKYLDIWSRHEFPAGDGNWVPDKFYATCHGLQGLLDAELHSLKSEQEIFFVGRFEAAGEVGFAYHGQFTGGRYIKVYRQPNAEGEQFFLEAKTATGKPSRYFASFGFMVELLPELCQVEVAEPAATPVGA